MSVPLPLFCNQPMMAMLPCDLSYSQHHLKLAHTQCHTISVAHCISGLTTAMFRGQQSHKLSGKTANVLLLFIGVVYSSSSRPGTYSSCTSNITGELGGTEGLQANDKPDSNTWSQSCYICHSA
jgi:hypothetical protein